MATESKEVVENRRGIGIQRISDPRCDSPRERLFRIEPFAFAAVS